MLNKYLRVRNGLALVCVTVAFSSAAFAQTTGSCPQLPSAVAAMSLEQVINPAVDVLSTQAVPPLPPGVEIHQSFVLDPLSLTVSGVTFVVPTGSPVPTPPSAITAANTLQSTTIQINQILTGSNPAPSLMLVGVTVSGPPGGFPSSVGTPTIITMGYVQGSVTDRLTIVRQVNNLALIVAGEVISWAPTATGSLTLGFPPVGSKTAYCGS